MKVLLAPLFFRSRMCKHCARLFYKENPGAWLGIHEFESLPPLGTFDPRRGFVPDYPSLMMFDEYVIDAEAYERLKHPGDRAWLTEWRDLVDALHAEGALTVEDVGAAATARSHQRGAMLRQDARHPDKWWNAMAYYNALTSRADRLLGASPSQAQELAWEFDPEDGFGVEGTDGQVHNLAVVLADTKNSSNEAHRELFELALAEVKHQLREVNACLVACDELGVAPMMWAPYRKYMEAKLPHAPEVAFERAASEFFNVAFPAYTPTTARGFDKARSRKAIGALRAEILRASETGDALDPQYPQRVLTEVLKLEAKSARMRKIVGWIANAIGIIPVPGLGLAASAAGEGVATLVDKQRRKSWRWFYVISDGRGVT
jgi:hypothetical protein